MVAIQKTTFVWARCKGSLPITGLAFHSEYPVARDGLPFVRISRRGSKGPLPLEGPGRLSSSVVYPSSVRRPLAVSRLPVVTVARCSSVVRPLSSVLRPSPVHLLFVVHPSSVICPAFVCCLSSVCLWALFYTFGHGDFNRSHLWGSGTCWGMTKDNCPTMLNKAWMDGIAMSDARKSCTGVSTKWLD